MTIDKHYPSAYTFGGIDISFPFPLDSVKSLEYKFLDPLELGWKSGKEGKEEEEKRKKKKHSKRLYSRVQWAGFIPGKDILWKIEDDCSAFSREQSPPPGSAIFFITFLISYPPSLRNCNTNSYCDLCWYQWQPLVVSLLIRARPPPSPSFSPPPAYHRKDTLLAPTVPPPRPDIMLYWIRVVTVIVAFSPSSFYPPLPPSPLHSLLRLVLVFVFVPAARPALLGWWLPNQYGDLYEFY